MPYMDPLAYIESSLSRAIWRNFSWFCLLELDFQHFNRSYWLSATNHTSRRRFFQWQRNWVRYTALHPFLAPETLHYYTCLSFLSWPGGTSPTAPGAYSNVDSMGQLGLPFSLFKMMGSWGLQSGSWVSICTGPANHFFWVSHHFSRKLR